MCGTDESGHPLFATSSYREPSKERVYFTSVLATSVDTLLHLDESRLVSPLGRGESGLEILLWYPETRLEQASVHGRADTAALFRHNYPVSAGKLF